nr:hypothetical protein GCM10010200_082050 [Actinomadura rugatobispora]
MAAGWFLRGVWDFVHLKLDKVAYAQGVDIIIAVQLVALA